MRRPTTQTVSSRAKATNSDVSQGLHLEPPWQKGRDITGAQEAERLSPGTGKGRGGGAGGRKGRTKETNASGIGQHRSHRRLLGQCGPLSWRPQLSQSTAFQVLASLTVKSGAEGEPEQLGFVAGTSAPGFA